MGRRCTKYYILLKRIRPCEFFHAVAARNFAHLYVVSSRQRRIGGWRLRCKENLLAYKISKYNGEY